jgi:hypothetical protein
MKSAPRFLRLPAAPIWLVAAALFGSTLALGKALFWGTPSTQFVPWWSWAWGALLDGHLPLWNPLAGMGAPLAANYQSALFYPPNWLYLLLYALGGTPWLAWGMALLVGLHLAWAGLGMAALVRRLGLGTLAQAIGGLAFGFCGYLVARAGFLSINATAAWLPWIMLCLTPRAPGQRPPHRVSPLLALPLAFLLLAGHAQTAWYTLLLAGMWAGFWAWEADRLTQPAQPGSAAQSRAGALAGAWGWLLAALVLGACLAAVQLIPTAEYLLSSQRVEAVDYELAMSYSFWPWRLVELLAPGFFGHPAQGDYWGYANYWEDALYIGLLPMLLALGAILGNFKRTGMETHPSESSPSASLLAGSGRRLVWFCLAIFLAALLLGLGRNTPVFPWLYRYAPTFDLFQAPTRIMLWAEFVLALLAALGAERWRRPEGRGLYWTRLGSAGAFAVSLGAGAAWYALGDISPSFIRATALAGMWGLTAGALSLLAPTRQAIGEPGKGKQIPEGLWRWVVAMVVGLDLFVAGWGLNPSADLDLYRLSPLGETVQRLADGSRLYLPAAHEEYLKFTRFFRFESFDPGEDWLNLRAAMLPNTYMLDGVSSANNFDPLLTGRYTRWMDYLDWAGPALRPRLLDLMDVGVEERVDLRQPYGVRFDPRAGGQRVRWTPCARLVRDEEEAWAAVMAGGTDFQASVVIETTEGEAFTGNPNTLRPDEDCPYSGSSPESARIIEESPNRLEIQLEAPQDGWLFLSDAWYPGWRAWVDGQRAQITPANYLFRAVQVPAGSHQVVFRYQPASFWSGAALSLLGCCAWVLLWRRSRGTDGR